MKSDTTGKPKRAGRKPVHKRQNNYAVYDMATPVAGRHRLLRLQAMVKELREKECSYRDIAILTGRGVAAHGYFQRIEAGDHLGKRPGIRPNNADFRDLEIITQTARVFADADERLLRLAMDVVETRAALDGAIARLINGVRK